MKISGTNWYTAYRTYPDEKGNQVPVYGYRMPVKDRDSRELHELMALLKADGVETKLRVSQNSHVGIPAGTPFIQVFDNDSAIALEKIFLKQGIELPVDRFKEYGMEYMKRGEVSASKKQYPPKTISWFSKLFGGRNG